MRVVALIDMDCFYAQVEQRDCPELWDKPVAVVQHAAEGSAGGILAVSYEARPSGVKRGMMVAEAMLKCPTLNVCFVPQGEHIDKADIQKYRDASAEVFDVLFSVDKRIVVERASVDEAFLDMTQMVDDVIAEIEDPSVFIDELLEDMNSFFPTSHLADGNDINEHKSDTFVYDRETSLKQWIHTACRQDKTQLRLAIAMKKVEEVRAAIRAKTQFFCSAGIANNKMLAKLVCARHKPRQQTLLPFSFVDVVLRITPIEDVRGLGGKLGNAIQQTFNIKMMGELSSISLEHLQKRFQHTGDWLQRLSRGYDDEPVKARNAQSSIAVSKNFVGKNALVTVEEVNKWLEGLCKELAKRLLADQLKNDRTAENLTIGLIQGAPHSYSSWGGPRADGSGTSQTRSRLVKMAGYDLVRITTAVKAMAKNFNSAPKDSNKWEPPVLNIFLNASRFSNGIAATNKTIMQWVDEAKERPKNETDKIPNNDVGDDIIWMTDEESTRGSVLDDQGWQRWNASELDDVAVCEFPTDIIQSNTIAETTAVGVENVTAEPSTSTSSTTLTSLIRVEDEQDLLDVGGMKVSRSVLEELPPHIRMELTHMHRISESKSLLAKNGNKGSTSRKRSADQKNTTGSSAQKDLRVSQGTAAKRNSSKISKTSIDKFFPKK